MAEVKLIGHELSPFSRRAVIALKVKGIEYEFIKEDLPNKSALLLKHNPIHKKVPVLLHNEKPIVESLLIAEYLDETFPGTPLLPQDPYEKAKARFWAKFVDDKCVPALWKSIWSKGEEQEKAKEEAEEALKILDNELKDKKFFGGDNINIVDIAANFIALWLGVLEEASGVEILREEKYPRLCKWISEYLNYIIIKENLPARDDLLAYFGARYRAANASN